MKCFFDSKGNPKTKLTVIGEHEEIEIEVLIDTGFNGSLMLPLQYALPLHLKLVSSAPVNYADGSIKNSFILEGKVKFKNKITTTDIFLTEDDEGKIGNVLLSDYKLLIDYKNQKIRVT